MPGPGMSYVLSNVGGYNILSPMLCCHLKCKGFVLGPGISAVP